MNDAYVNPYRPLYEKWSVATWTLAAGLLAGSAYTSPFPPRPFLILAGLAAVMAVLRALQAYPTWRNHRLLKGQPLSYITIAELEHIVEKNPDMLWIGRGFDFGPEEAQRLHEVERTGPKKLAPRCDRDMGEAWIHGLGQAEKDLFIPLDHTFGHVLWLATTRWGKTRSLDLAVTQAILRGESVVVIDPKGDIGLRDAMRDSLAYVGRPEDFVYFHPSFPEHSWRIDALRNFSRATELASRLAMLIPGESDVFTSFGQMALTTIAGGLLLTSTKPSIMMLRRYLEGEPESLLIQASRAWFAKHVEQFEPRLAAYVRKAEQDTEAALAQSHIDFYRREVREDHPSPELDSLISFVLRSRDWVSRMLGSLSPILSQLTAGELGKLLSPDPNDPLDRRPITDFGRIIRNQQCAYIGLASLSDSFVGTAIAGLFLTDLAAYAGARYDYGTDLKPVNVFVDEAAAAINPAFVTLLNQGGGALVRVAICSQSTPDFAARTGSENRGRQILANTNHVFAGRVLDGNTQAYFTENLTSVHVRHIERSQGSSQGTNNPTEFNATATERLIHTETEIVPAPLLAKLPNLEFFARISGGRLVKGRTPILIKSEKAA